MKVIYNNLIPFKGFKAINLFGVIFARKEYREINQTTINHETIHTAQMRELLYIGFYIWYLIEWIINLIKFKDSTIAYYNIKFEKEAYIYEYDYTYLSYRKHYNWIKL